MNFFGKIPHDRETILKMNDLNGREEKRGEQKK